jgi:uncharacterized protein YggE
MEINNNPQQSHGIPNWIFIGLGVLLMLFVVLLIIQKGHDLQTSFANTKPANTISVSGTGKVTATPDLATVNIGVLSQGTTAVDVKNQNNSKVGKIIDFVKAQGVDAKDISTAQFSFYPQQNYGLGNSTPTITGYQGNQTITVKVHGVDKDQTVLEKVLDGAVNNGANEINGVNLSVENPDALQQQAQKAAIADAKQKATDLAKEAGLNLGKVVSVSESSGGYPGPLPYAMDSAPMGMGGGTAKSIAPSIQPGSQEISEVMTVTFEVR